LTAGSAHPTIAPYDTFPARDGLFFLAVGNDRQFRDLADVVPIVGVNSGYCFAGNVMLLGVCDVIIATRDSSLGVGGPAMIEGGGLGAYAPGEVGPVSIQEPNGVIDIVVEDEAEATAVALGHVDDHRSHPG
jgi:acetyl-CoA carboxylase carboxyltransferase component